MCLLLYIIIHRMPFAIIIWSVEEDEMVILRYTA